MQTNTENAFPTALVSQANADKHTQTQTNAHKQRAERHEGQTFIVSENSAVISEGF